MRQVLFVGLALLLTEGFAPYADVWGPAVAVVAAATMTVGNLAALRQLEVGGSKEANKDKPDKGGKSG